MPDDRREIKRIRHEADIQERGYVPPPRPVSADRPPEPPKPPPPPPPKPATKGYVPPRQAPPPKPKI
jgi:hypothetical protein